MASVPVADLDEILSRTDKLWRDLAGSRLFITGGTGFFGTWLLESIAAANDRSNAGVAATVLSRDPSGFLSRAPHLAGRREFDWLQGQPSDFAFPRRPHDFLVHLATATSAHDGQTDPVEMLTTKFMGIRRLLEFANRTGIRRALVTSSGAIYGPQPSDIECLPETFNGAPDPTVPAAAYGQGKRLVEQMCAVAPGIDCVIARCFSFAGPHLPLDARFAAGNFLRDALAGGPIRVGGDGTPLRSYLYAADLAAWLLTLLVKGRGGRAYNVGSDQAVSILQLAGTVAAIAGGCEVVVAKRPDGSPAQRYVPSIARARDELELDVWTPLPTALKRTLDWARGNSAG